jgi:hypothetical protein
MSSTIGDADRAAEHLSSQVQTLILRCTATSPDRISQRKQRRFLKYEQALSQCGADIHALERFVNAQVVAFRKILKKYRKWTGSAALGIRFKDVVLSHSKSFTKRDFSQLQTQYEELQATLRAASPVDLQDVQPSSEINSPRRHSEQLSPVTVVNVSTEQGPGHATGGYWNEYDHGSDAGELDQGEGYVIYINPDDKSGFFGMAALVSATTSSMAKMRSWFKARRPAGDSRRDALLPTHSSSYGTVPQSSYFTSPPGGALTDTEAEDESDAVSPVDRRGSYGYASSEEFPVGYEAHYASLPSIDDQRMKRYREKVLFWGTVGCYTASIVLLGVAAVLISTGRHRLRVEVDAGVTLGVVASLGCACAALGMNFAREDTMSWINRLTVWLTFALVCVLNGMLLVLVMGNTGI